MRLQNAGNGAAMPAERPKPKKQTKKMRRRMWSGRQPMAMRQRAAKAPRISEIGDIARIRADAEAAMAAAQQSNARLREAIDILPQGIVFLDAEGRYILWNEKYAEIYERSADQFKPGARLEDALRVGVARGDYPEAAGREEDWIAERLEKLRHPKLRHEQMLSDGRCILMEDRLTGDGGVIGLRVDITELKQREASFRLLFDGNPVPMIVCAQEDGSVLSANDAAVAHYGYSRADFEKLKISDVQAFDQATPWAVEQTTEERAARTWKHVKADGSLIDVAIYSRLLVFEGRRAVLLALMDITERKRAEARLAFMAQHDGLTGLPNRILLRQRLDELLAHTRRTGDKVAVMFLDLDNFKTINDTLGHAAGDKLLKGVTRRLRSSLREDDAVARLGSDEFAVVQAGVTRPEEIAQLARRLIQTISEPYLFDGHTIVSGASIGIAIAPGDGDDAEKLLKNADMALSRAKSEGLGTFSFFEAEMDARAQSRRRIEIELREAIEANVLQPHYQPLIDLTNGRITGLEALVRWPHAERGDAAPRLLGRRAMARRRAGRRQPVAAAVPGRQPAVGGDGCAQGLRAAAEAARDRDHRDGAARQERLGARHAARAARARRAHLDGRFRHRLFVAELPAQLPVRQDQDRPVVCARPRFQSRRAGDHPFDRLARPGARRDDHRRGRRDRSRIELPAQRGLPRRPGLPVQPRQAERRDRAIAAGAASRPGRAAAAVERRHAGGLTARPVSYRPSARR
jgi:diguanylate cyclase (GGDEF)-like protein/PAS domain S-box-containing protein